MENAYENLELGHERVRVAATAQVWMEGDAERQLVQAATHHDCVAAVGMPDLHPGPGVPIGAALGFAQTVHPHLVGSDAGCGALVVALGKVKLPGALARRARAAFAEALVDDDQHEARGQAAWSQGPAGLLRFGCSSALAALIGWVAGDTQYSSGVRPGATFGAALGTIGGGNHFAEIGRVTRVLDDAVAAAAGLHKGSLVLLCHSGSRGLGKTLSDKWGHEPLAEPQAQAYLAELAGAVRFARANRVLIAERLLRALGVTRASKLAGAFDVVHNSVTRERCGADELWVHRKGCAPAHDGQLTVVLGSRGAPSWIMRGLGNPAGLSSVAHGAGRKMQRSEARAKIRARYRRDQLRGGGVHGATVICDDTKLLYEEHPDVYKPIEPVIDSLEQFGLAARVAAVEPQLTVKT